MFADPQSVTVNAVAKSMPRIAIGDVATGKPTRYEFFDGSFSLEIAHQTTKAGRIRTTVELVETKAVTDPISTETDSDSCTVRVLVDRPSYGWTDVQLGYLTEAIKAWLTTANVTKLYGRES